jgi:hypothetical protein
VFGGGVNRLPLEPDKTGMVDWTGQDRENPVLTGVLSERCTWTRVWRGRHKRVDRELLEQNFKRLFYREGRKKVQCLTTTKKFPGGGLTSSKK